MRANVLCLLFSLPALATAPPALAKPNASGPPTAITSPAFNHTEVSVGGTGFGPSGTTYVKLIFPGETDVVYPNDPSVRKWSDTLIDIDWPGVKQSGYVRVFTDAGTTVNLRLVYYRYDSYELGSSTLPLAISLDSAGRIWTDDEYHRSFHVLSPPGATAISIPSPASPPFASTLFDADFRVYFSTTGEDVLVDPNGIVYLTEGGDWWYSGINPNHSRIVGYVPSTQEIRVYNMPGDNNEVWGLAYDTARRRLWFTSRGTLTSFDPYGIPFDNTFNFDASLDYQVCQPGQADYNCYHEYTVLPDGSFPGHMAIDSTGHVWFTVSYGPTRPVYGNAIGRLDPSSGSTEMYPLPPALNPSPLNPSGGPWQILISPAGEIYFTEFGDNTVSHFKKSMIGSAACRVLNNYNQNPCIESKVVPDSQFDYEGVHSLALDAAGNIWFSQGGFNSPVRNGRLGYVTSDWSTMVLLPTLEPYPCPGGEEFSPAGLTINPPTGEIWFADLLRHRIGRLTKL